MASPQSQRLDRFGARAIARDLIFTAVHLPVLLGAAGRADWCRAWIYIGLALLYLVVHSALLAKLNPDTVNARGRVTREETATFDRVFVAVYVLVAFAASVIAGLDVRWGATMPDWTLAAGSALFLLGSGIGTWAVAVNRHFEMTVRIQEERDHRVCRAGPYRFVRHPGYSAFVFASPAFPLMLGSWWAIAPTAALILIFVVRTALEDRMLLRDLPGYREYAAEVRFRLVPGVW